MKDNYSKKKDDSTEIESALKKLPLAVKMRIKDIIIGALIVQETEDKVAG